MGFKLKCSLNCRTTRPSVSLIFIVIFSFSSITNAQVNNNPQAPIRTGQGMPLSLQQKHFRNILMTT